MLHSTLFKVLSFLLIVSNYTITAQVIKKELSSTRIIEEQHLFKMAQLKAIEQFDDSTTRGIIEIPVQIHIAGNPAQKSIISATEIKKTFSKLNQKLTSIYVRLVLLDDFNFIDNDKLWVFDYKNEQKVCKSSDKKNTLNVYITNEITREGISTCGYTHLPQAENNNNRILITAGCFKNFSPFVRQIGHFFSLYPTAGRVLGEQLEFVSGKNCASSGDYICDTPADPGIKQKNIDKRCNFIGRQKDKSEYKKFYHPDVSNFMSDNPNTSCCNHFTKTQLKHILHAIVQSRSTLRFKRSNKEQKKLVKAIAQNKIGGTVNIKAHSKNMRFSNKNSIYLNKVNVYDANTKYRVEVTPFAKSYVYIFEGDASRGLNLLYPTDSKTKPYLRDLSKKTFPTSKTEYYEMPYSTDKKNQLIVLFSKQQLNVKDIKLSIQKEKEKSSSPIEQIYQLFGEKMIFNKSTLQDNQEATVKGQITSRNILPIFIQYKHR